MTDVNTTATTHDDADLEKLVGFLAELADAAGEVFEDGKLSIGDFRALNMVAEAMHGFLTLDRSKLLPEAKDLLDNPTLVQHLADLFMEKFNIPEQHATEIVKEMVPFAVDLYTTVNHAAESVKRFKAMVSA